MKTLSPPIQRVNAGLEEDTMQKFSSRQICRAMAAFVIGLFCLSVQVLAQGTNGSLTGQVTDPSGAAVVGAQVTLTNVGTNYAQTAASDTTGVYQFKLVQPGNYVLLIDAPGFAKYNQKGIVMNANLNATQNVRLKVAASAGETITVEANAELINTTSAELGITVNSQSVSELPLNGRDPSALALLAPGMVDGVNKVGFTLQAGFSFPTESAASANGGRQGSTYYMLDGVTNMDNYMAVNSPTPNPDATQEFRLISNNFSAIYGFSSGGVVSMATKNGTNEFHGNLFEFLRNQELNAKNWNSKSLDPLKRNQFGGSIGGPILKDKLFFFGNYQGTRSVGTGSSNETTTPTAQMLEGDFSGLVTYAQANNPTYCGTSGAGYGTIDCGFLNGPFKTVNGTPNQLEGSLNSAAVQFTKDGLPGHSTAASGTSSPSSGSQNLAGQLYYDAAAIRNNFDEYTGRLDYDLTAKQRVTLRSFIDKFSQPSGDTPGNVLSVLNLSNWAEGFQETMYYYNEVLQHTWTLPGDAVNTATLLWTEQSAHNAASVKDSSGKDMCWSRYINVTEPTGSCYMEGATWGGTYGGWTEPSQEVRYSAGFSDTLLKTIHRHSLATGLDVMRQSAVENTLYPAVPIIKFGGSYTGNAMADWLLGYMSSFTQGAGEIADVKGWQVDPYLNDEFRLRPNLTITAGIRWDPDLAPTSMGARGAAFVAGQQSTAFPNAPTGLIFPGDKGMNAQLRPSSMGFWEPRIGAAWQPERFPHTSVHAGFGLFSGPVAYSAYNHVADVAPYSPTFTPNAPSSSPICYTNGTQSTCAPNSNQTVAGYMNFDDPWSTSSFGTNGVSPFPPFASISNKPSSSSTFPTQTGGQVSLGASFGRKFKAGMTESWNLSVEQQLSQTMAINIAYVGSESYHQSYVRDVNFAKYCAACGTGSTHSSTNPYSQFSQILEEDSDATASYNSLQVAFTRHMSHGLQAQESFTWQKTIDVASVSNISFGTPEIGNPFSLAWNRGISSLSIPFTSVTNFVYVVPELKNQKMLVRQILSGWEISPIITLQSGSPFGISGGNSTYWNSIDASLNENNTGSGCKSNCSDRGDRVAGQALKVRNGGRSKWIKSYFNTDAFVPRKDGEFGTSGRNILVGPPTFNVDASLMKNWSILEKYKIQFRMELFNALNHAVMSTPDTNPSDSTFGQINGGAGYASNASRVGQAALKFSF